MTVLGNLNNENNFTLDHLLNGRIALKQPKEGYRVAIDPIFLAASVAVTPGEFVLDVGAGVGAASLCLASRVPHCRIIGIEQNKDLVHLATDNVRQNNLRDRVEILSGNLLNPPPRLAAGSYAQVISNPPFFEVQRGRQSSIATKKDSNHGTDVDLESWIKFCLLMLKPNGRLTLICKTDMLDRLLQLFYGKVGNIIIFPLWAGPDKKASRVIVRATKASNIGLTMLPGIVLHQADGAFAQKAEAVLRHGESLNINSSEA